MSQCRPGAWTKPAIRSKRERTPPRLRPLLALPAPGGGVPPRLWEEVGRGASPASLHIDGPLQLCIGIADALRGGGGLLPPSATDGAKRRPPAISQRHPDTDRRTYAHRMTVPPHELPHPLTGVRFPSPVPPGSGWPDDAATGTTPIADTAEDIERLATDANLDEVTARSSVCRACPRLVAWRQQVAVDKRASFSDQPYWGRPIPGWGDPAPHILVVGLAPAAHGGNRTGRVFTGDRSGDWLFAALHRVGLANSPDSVHAGDGLTLDGVRIVAAVRCAPPDNKPTPAERDTCAGWLDREVELALPSVRSIVALGGFAWSATLGTLQRNGVVLPQPRPTFGHGVEATLAGPHGPLRLLGCYHPSQQNTFTGRLTEPMIDKVLGRARL